MNRDVLCTPGAFFLQTLLPWKFLIYVGCLSQNSSGTESCLCVLEHGAERSAFPPQKAAVQVKQELWKVKLVIKVFIHTLHNYSLLTFSILAVLDWYWCQDQHSKSFIVFSSNQFVLFVFNFVFFSSSSRSEEKKAQIKIFSTYEPLTSLFPTRV